MRITPNELHIRDSQFYDQIYSTTKKRDKWSDWVTMAGAPGSGFATVDHRLHQNRRSPLNNFFSKSAIASKEAQITSHVQHLCRRLKECIESNEVVRLDCAFMAL